MLGSSRKWGKFLTFIHQGVAILTPCGCVQYLGPTTWKTYNLRFVTSDPNKPDMKERPFDDDPRQCWEYLLVMSALLNEVELGQQNDVLVRPISDTSAVRSTIGWARIGISEIYYSGHVKERKCGVGLVVRRRLRRRVLPFFSGGRPCSRN